MAGAIKSFTPDGSGADGTSFTTTETYTFRNSHLYLCGVIVERATGGLPTGVTLTGGGLTWELIDSNQIGTHVGKSFFLFRAQESSGVTSGTLTVTGGQTESTWRLIPVEIGNVPTAGDADEGQSNIVQSAKANGADSSVTNVTPTLSAFASAENMLVVFSAHAANDTFSATAGTVANLVPLENTNNNNTAICVAAGKANAGTTITWDGPDHTCSIAVEVACNAGVGLIAGWLNNDSTDGTNFTIPHARPMDSEPTYVFVSARHASAGNPISFDPTISGAGMAWVLEKSVGFDDQRLALFRGIGASPTYGPITVTWGQTVGRSIQRIICPLRAAVRGTNASGSIVQSVSGYGDEVASLTLTLAPFAATANAVLGFFNVDNNSLMADVDGDSTIYTTVGGGSPGLASGIVFKSFNDTTIKGGVVGGSTDDILGIAIEIPYVVPPVNATIVANHAGFETGDLTEFTGTTTFGTGTSIGASYEQADAPGGWSLKVKLGGP